MLRCSLFSLFEGKVMTKILSLQTFLPLFLQLIATTAPKGDKSLTPPQNLSCSKDNLANSCNFQNYCLYLQRYRKLEDMSVEEDEALYLLQGLLIRLKTPVLTIYALTLDDAVHTLCKGIVGGFVVLRH